MVLLYAELFALLLVSFLVGCAVTGGLVRLLVRRHADRVSSYVAEAGAR
jgi:hypothetical protein